MYSQHFIFFKTYKWDQLTRVFYYFRLKELATDKHTSLLGPVVSCKENEVL
jgi:hypothetical protein